MLVPIRDFNPTRSFPVITLAIIGLNVYVFFQELAQGSPRALEAFIFHYGLIPRCLSNEAVRNCAYVYHPVIATLLTSMFLHGGWLHIIGNMLYLWIFGNNVEDALGSLTFALFYLVCGLAAAFTQYLIDPNSTVPIVGASGAIAGVLGAYLVLFPGAQVQTAVFLGCWLTFIRLPALIVLGLWIAVQFWTGYGSLGVAHQTGGVAVFAHIGGFLMGAVLVLALRPSRSP